MSAECKTETATVYVAGDINQARRILSEYCWNVGLCVTVTPTAFVYTGGEEVGIAIGLVNYPRFPVAAGEVYERAKQLAIVLRDGLFQKSALVVGGATSEWFTRETPQGR